MTSINRKFSHKQNLKSIDLTIIAKKCVNNVLFYNSIFRIVYLFQNEKLLKI